VDREQGPALDRSNHRLLFRTGLARNAYPDTHVSDQLGDYQVADLRTSRVAGFLEASTVRWLRQEGRFAPGIRVGRRIVWDEAQLLAWVEANLRNDSSSTAA
jgi:outer membrane scaffolding protein for murein synthesis (MipA/OmpV family)